MKNKLQGVYLITDTSIQQRYTHAELAEMALNGGANLIQFRDKKQGTQQALSSAESIVEACNDYQAASIINDRVDLALAAEASGVHLGQSDLPIPAARKLLGNKKIIGGTSANLEQAKRVEAQGADYVALGHIFETTTKKKDYAALGLEYLHQVCQVVAIPVVAIGGITLQNTAEVISAGADMIAVSSAICCTANPQEATKELADLFP